MAVGAEVGVGIVLAVAAGLGVAVAAAVDIAVHELASHAGTATMRPRARSPMRLTTLVLAAVLVAALVMERGPALAGSGAASRGAAAAVRPLSRPHPALAAAAPSR